MTATKKTLYRLPGQGQISGVCAGLADYFDLDVTLVRIIFVALAFATGGGMVLLYIILSIIVPAAGDANGEKAGNDESKKDKKDQDKLNASIQQLTQDMKDNGGIDTARNYLGLGLVAIGLWLLFGQFFPGIFAWRWDYVWPVLLICIGFFVITRRKD